MRKVSAGAGIGEPPGRWGGALIVQVPVMLMVGLALDLHDFARYRTRSVVSGLASALIPAIVGTAAA